jgi:hypothetical protein
LDYVPDYLRVVDNLPLITTADFDATRRLCLHTRAMRITNMLATIHPQRKALILDRLNPVQRTWAI